MLDFNKYNDYQKKIIDKLLPFVNSKPDPKLELIRLCLLYKDIVSVDNDRLVLDYFKTCIYSQLFGFLAKEMQFYQDDRFIEEFDSLFENYMDEHVEATEIDFIKDCILAQEKIIDKTFEYHFKYSKYDSLELMQFVGRDFLNQYKIRSQRKKMFLQKRLSKLSNATSSPITTSYSWDKEKSYPIKQLYKSLLENNLIEDNIEDIFIKAFTAQPLPLEHKIKWLHSMSLLAHFINEIKERDFIGITDNQWAQMSNIFLNRSGNSFTDDGKYHYNNLDKTKIKGQEIISDILSEIS
ncbi:MAG: hypothetical protein P8K77_05870 [Polaribacter sp.]|nr:hypothetical protein [Polaribacter sp.]